MCSLKIVSVGDLMPPSLHDEVSALSTQLSAHWHRMDPHIEACAITGAVMSISSLQSTVYSPQDAPRRRYTFNCLHSRIDKPQSTVEGRQSTFYRM